MVSYGTRNTDIFGVPFAEFKPYFYFPIERLGVFLKISDTLPAPSTSRGFVLITDDAVYRNLFIEHKALVILFTVDGFRHSDSAPPKLFKPHRTVGLR